MKKQSKKVKSVGRVSFLRPSADYVMGLIKKTPENFAGKGLEFGLTTLLSKTLLRRLPVPFNFVVPFVTEKVIIAHGVPAGRELLLKGLRWVKKATDE